MQQELDEHVSYEQDGTVGIWKITDLNEALQSGALEDAEAHFRETVESESMRGTVVEIGNADSLDPEVLEHVGEEWTRIGEETCIEATAYVADGIAKLAVANKNESDIEKKGFRTIDDAVEWAESFE